MSRKPTPLPSRARDDIELPQPPAETLATATADQDGPTAKQRRAANKG